MLPAFERLSEICGGRMTDTLCAYFSKREYSTEEKVMSILLNAVQQVFFMLPAVG